MAQRVHSLNRPNMVSVGTIIWMYQELMIFAGLFAMYFVSKANSGGDWPSYPVHLNVPFAVTITVILIASPSRVRWVSSRRSRATCSASDGGT